MCFALLQIRVRALVTTVQAGSEVLFARPATLHTSHGAWSIPTRGKLFFEVCGHAATPCLPVAVRLITSRTLHYSQVEYFREPLQSWQQLHPKAAEQLKALLQDDDAGYNPAFLLQLVCDDLAFSSEQAMDLLNCLHG